MTGDIVLYGRDNLADLTVPDNDDARYAYNYLSPMITGGVRKYIRNIDTELMILKIDELLLPVNICDKECGNSYTSSLYTHYVSYSAEELWELNNPRLEWFFKKVLSVLGWCCRRCQTDRVVYVNNWFLSTNLYPEITGEQYGRITEFLKKRYPGHAIVFRSLNEHSNSKDIGFLKELGYGLLGSRQVYIFDYDKRRRLTGKIKNKLNKDIRLLESGRYRVTDIREEQAAVAEKLYNQLYLDKYSLLNPQFSDDFYRLCISRKLLHFRVFSNDKGVCAVLGYYVRNHVMTTPVFGYDTSISQDQGVYRAMSAQLVLESENNGCTVNNSSGASKFKMWRGAVPALEYSAVYYRHLSLLRKTGYRLLRLLINGIAMKLIKHYGL